MEETSEVWAGVGDGYAAGEAVLPPTMSMSLTMGIPPPPPPHTLIGSAGMASSGGSPSGTTGGGGAGSGGSGSGRGRGRHSSGSVGRLGGLGGPGGRGGAGAAVAAAPAPPSRWSGGATSIGGGGVARRGPLVVIESGVVLVSGGLFLALLIESPWQLYLTLGLAVGCGANLMTFTAHSQFLPNWFVRNRAFAISLAFSGVGVGAIVLLPWLQTIIATEGWRAACWAWRR